MNQTTLGVIVAALTATISILATYAATQRQAGRDTGREEQRVADMLVTIGRMEERLAKLERDVNGVGIIARESRTVLEIASRTGEVPKYTRRVSGEGATVG